MLQYYNERVLEGDIRAGGEVWGVQSPPPQHLVHMGGGVLR